MLPARAHANRAQTRPQPTRANPVVKGEWSHIRDSTYFINMCIVLLWQIKR